MNSNKVKKIISIVIISVVMAIIVATIVLALIPKRLYNPITEGYEFVAIYQKDNDTSNRYFTNSESEEQKDVTSKIAEYLEDSFKDNVLSSIFQGTGRYDYRVVKASTSIESNVTKNATCVAFGYKEEQKLIFKGEEYKNSQATDPTKTITFVKLVMPVSNDNDFQERTVYLVDSDGSSDYQIKFLAHQNKLYTYIEESLEW